MPFTADAGVAWWVWTGAIFDTNQNTWIWRTSAEQVHYLNWLSAASVSSMDGQSHWLWGVDEPNLVYEWSEYCSYITPTHSAGLLNAQCDITSYVLCEYD